MASPTVTMLSGGGGTEVAHVCRFSSPQGRNWPDGRQWSVEAWLVDISKAENQERRLEREYGRSIDIEAE